MSLSTASIVVVEPIAAPGKEMASVIISGGNKVVLSNCLFMIGIPKLEKQELILKDT